MPATVGNRPTRPTALNRLLDQVDDLLERERRFIADAAHELRTPLAILRIHAQNAQSLGLAIVQMITCKIGCTLQIYNRTSGGVCAELGLNQASRPYDALANSKLVIQRNGASCQFRPLE